MSIAELLALPYAFAQVAAPSPPVTIIAPIPGEGGDVNTISGDVGGGVLYAYIGVIFTWLAGIVGLVLLGFVVFYGFLLMFAGIEDKTEEAKKGLTASLGGLILLMCTGLLLYTLNPNFFGGFGNDTNGGVILGTTGGGYTEPTKPTEPTEPGEPAPQASGDDAVAACEPVGLKERGSANEPVGQRPDVNAQNIAQKKQQYGTQIRAAIGQPDIDPTVTENLMAAIMQQENSAGNPRLKSEAKARGMMQILPGTALDHCGIKDPEKLYDVQTNLNCGAKILSAYSRKAATTYSRSDRLRSTIAAYNGGSGRLVKSGACEGTNACGQAVTQWECLWDDKAHTKPNYKRAGNLAETRNYTMSVMRGLGVCPGDTAGACGGGAASTPAPAPKPPVSTDPAPPNVTSGVCAASHQARIGKCQVPAAKTLAQELLSLNGTKWKPWKLQSNEGMRTKQELQYIASGSCPCVEIYAARPDSKGSGFLGVEADVSKVKSALEGYASTSLTALRDLIRASTGTIEIRTIAGGNHRGLGHRRFQSADIAVVNGKSVEDLVANSLGYYQDDSGPTQQLTIDAATKLKSQTELCSLAQWLLQQRSVSYVFIHQVAKGVQPCRNEVRVLPADDHYRHFHVSFTDSDKDLGNPVRAFQAWVMEEYGQTWDLYPGEEE